MNKNQNYDHQCYFENNLKFFCRTPDITDTIDSKKIKEREQKDKRENLLFLPKVNGECLLETSNIIDCIKFKSLYHVKLTLNE